MRVDPTRIAIREMSRVSDPTIVDSRADNPDYLPIEITNSETGETKPGFIARWEHMAVEAGEAAVAVVKDERGMDRGIPISWITKGVKIPKGTEE